MSKLSLFNSREAVLKAIAECDEMGRDTFVKTYGFGRAREYFLLYEGKEYDSKAILGVAWKYQFPEDGALSPQDFSAGDQTVRPRLEALGFKFLVRKPEPERPPPNLDVGTAYSSAEIGRTFTFEGRDIGSLDGIVSCPELSSLLLISDARSRPSFDERDYWDPETGDLIYTGRGLIGDQAIEGLNREIADNGKHLYVFQDAGSNDLHFCGLATCRDYWWERSVDRNGDMRKVVRFRLGFDSKANLAAPATNTLQRDPLRQPRAFQKVPPVPSQFPVSKSSLEERQALIDKAAAEHHAILLQLDELLHRNGWTAVEEIPLAVDLWARRPSDSRRVIFEAKTISDSNEVSQTRHALAQLLEYRWVYGEEQDLLCLVTNSPISSPRVRFLEEHGVVVVYFENGVLRTGGARAELGLDRLSV